MQLVLGEGRQTDMEDLVVKEEPLDLDDQQGEDGDGMYSEDEGIMIKENLDCESFHQDS